MIRNIFMIYFKIFYEIFKKLFKLNHNLIVFIDNNDLINTKYLYEEIRKKYPEKKMVFIVKKKNLKSDYPVCFIGNLKSIFYLSTASFWFVHTHLHDFLKWKITPPKSCKYIQLWHATGALKKFGQDSVAEFIEHKNILLREREYIDSIVVTSAIWQNPFSSAFGVDKSKVKVLGSSRTDFFFNNLEKKKVIERLKKEFPQIINKKVILYAPTFRDNNLNDYNLELDLSKLFYVFGEEYFLLLKMHPHIKKLKNLEKNDKFYLNVSDYKNINELLLITDYLITDYSSVALDFCYLERPIIFFAYDLENYKNNIRGFYYNYEEFIPKKSLAKTTDQIIKIIKENLIESEELKKFREKNHKYNDGKSSYRIMKAFLEKNENNN